MKDLFFNTLWFSLALIVASITASIVIGINRSVRAKIKEDKNVEKKD